MTDTLVAANRRVRLGRWSVVAVLGLAAVGVAAWFLRPGPPIDVVYRTVDGQALTVDLDYPAEGRGPFPVVIFGPAEGDWDRDFKREDRFRVMIETFTQSGYVVATPRYRNPVHHKFPGPIEDGKVLVRWLRANGAKRLLATDRIGAMGASLGGYGACMLGTTGPDDGFEGGDEYREHSSRVQAVAALGAPVDLTTKTWPDLAEKTLLEPFLGAKFANNSEVYRRASPGTYATKDDPPFLLIHSTEDLIVPVRHSRRFAEQLKAVGVPVTLVEARGLPHVWKGDRLRETVKQVVEFFDRHLKG